MGKFILSKFIGDMLTRAIHFYHYFYFFFLFQSSTVLKTTFHYFLLLSDLDIIHSLGFFYWFPLNF